MWTHYTLLRNARSKQQVRTYDLLRKSVLRSFRMRKARLDVSRNRAKQEQIKSASGGPPGAFATWQAAGEKHPQPPAQALGSFLGVKAKPLRGRGKPRALTPIHSDSAPQAPARASGAFSSEGRVKGLVRPAAPKGRGHGLDATGATQACRQGVGGALPPAPLPLGEGPGRVPPEGAMGMRCRGTPCLGFQGRAALGPSAANKKPSAEGEHFLLFELRFWLFKRPQKGPDLQIQKGERRKLDLARVCED